MSDPARPHRGTIFVEDAVVRTIERFPDEQYVMRLEAPRCAAAATAGSFIHLRCDDAIPMRRPLSIMRANPGEGWIEVLFKIVGEGLHALARRQPGDRLSSMGPIGRGFVADRERPRTLLIGGGVGIPPMVFLAETLKDDLKTWMPLVVMGSEIPFPFELAKSAFDVTGVDPAVDASMPLMESWNVPSRLASLAGFPGTCRGYVTDLARQHLETLSDEDLEETAIFACGPTPMLSAVARLAAEFRLPCQVSLEEYMACAVGGCAGCTVRVTTAEGPAMKRVCVDGPVFEAATVFPMS
jgi:dihydroorotate dehydrogenase electron transfer subunit